MQEPLETWAWSLGREDPLEEEMATHYSILVWKIPWTKGPFGQQSKGLQKVGRDWAHTYASASFFLKHSYVTDIKKKVKKFDRKIFHGRMMTKKVIGLSF